MGSAGGEAGSESGVRGNADAQVMPPTPPYRITPVRCQLSIVNCQLSIVLILSEFITTQKLDRAMAALATAGLAVRPHAG